MYRAGLMKKLGFSVLFALLPIIALACGINSPDAIPHEATFSRFFARLSTPTILPRVKDVSRSLVHKHKESLPGFGERVALDSTTLKAWSNGGKTPKADKDARWSVKKGTQGLKESVYRWKLHLLSEARRFCPKFRPMYLMADAGYSGQAFLRLVKRQYRATPVVNINTSHKRLLREYGVQNTLEGKTLLKQRQAVERVFSRLKGQRSLNHITVRKWRKVTTHCYLSLIALQGNFKTSLA